MAGSKNKIWFEKKLYFLHSPQILFEIYTSLKIAKWSGDRNVAQQKITFSNMKNWKSNFVEIAM